MNRDNKLTLLQEKFCQLYTSYDNEVFGNGSRSYLKACNTINSKQNGKAIDVKVAGVLASRLLKKVNITNKINRLLEEGGFNNENVDKQHLFLINQYTDLKVKMSAIESFNKLKNRIKNKIEVELPKPILSQLFQNLN